MYGAIILNIYIKCFLLQAGTQLKSLIKISAVIFLLLFSGQAFDHASDDIASAIVELMFSQGRYSKHVMTTG